MNLVQFPVGKCSGRQIKGAVHVSEHLHLCPNRRVLREFSDFVIFGIGFRSISFTQQQQVNSSETGSLAAILPSVDLDRKLRGCLPVLGLHSVDVGIFTHVCRFEVRAGDNIPYEDGPSIPIDDTNHQPVFLLKVFDNVERWLFVANHKTRLSTGFFPLPDEVRQADTGRSYCGPTTQRSRPFADVVPGKVVFEARKQPRLMIDDCHQQNARNEPGGDQQCSHSLGPHPKARFTMGLVTLARAA